MNVVVLANSEATFVCIIMSEEGSLVDITWSGPDPLPVPTVTNVGGIITSNLTVSVENGSNAGELYNCTVSYTRCSLTNTSDSAMFIIIPSIIEAPESGIVKYLGNFSFVCEFTVSGSFNISWTGPISDIPSTEQPGVRTVRTTAQFTQLQFNEGGVYTCTLTNEAGSVSASATVFVEPVVFIMPMDGLVSAQEVAVFTCMVQDDPVSTIQWQKLDNPTYENVSGEIGRNLTFNPVEFGDEGDFRCRVATDNFGIFETEQVILTGNA